MPSTHIFFVFFAQVLFYLPVLLSTIESQTDYINALASMDYYLSNLIEKTHNPDAIAFSDTQIKKLWQRIKNQAPDPIQVEHTLQLYWEGVSIAESDPQKSQELLSQAFESIDTLWGSAVSGGNKERILYLNEEVMASMDDKDNLSRYPHLSSRMKKMIAPHVIPNTHTMKPILDSLFGKKRISATEKTLKAAGFKILFKQPRSFIVIASHPALEDTKTDYLIKCYLDSETRLKWKKEGWEWLVQRCIGAKLIKKVIKDKKIKYFEVAEKYLYPLPLLDKNPPYKPFYSTHPVILLTNNLHLVSSDENKYAWYTKMDKKRLNELYVLITHIKGASWRRDNIPYSAEKKKFCFCDTEYATKKAPEFHRIGRELNTKMAQYWNELVSNGGYVLRP